MILLLTHMDAAIQHIINCFPVVCKAFWTHDQPKRTAAISWIAYHPPNINIGGDILTEAQNFTYPSSIISNDATVRKDIYSHLTKASSSFGRIYKRFGQTIASVWVKRFWFIKLQLFLFYWMVLKHGFSAISVSDCSKFSTNNVCRWYSTSGGRTMWQMKRFLWEQTYEAFNALSFSCNTTAVGTGPGLKIPGWPKLFCMAKSVWGSKIVVPLGSVTKTSSSSNPSSPTSTSRTGSCLLQTGTPEMQA